MWDGKLTSLIEILRNKSPQKIRLNGNQYSILLITEPLMLMLLL